MIMMNVVWHAKTDSAGGIFFFSCVLMDNENYIYISNIRVDFSQIVIYRCCGLCRRLASNSKIISDSFVGNSNEYLSVYGKSSI